MFRKVVLAVCAAVLCVPVLASAERQDPAVSASVWFADPAAQVSLQKAATASGALSLSEGGAADVAASVDEATAAAVSATLLEQDEGMKKQLAGWLSDGKQVYIYGTGLTLPSVADQLGIDELADAEGEDMKAANKNNDKKEETVHIVGLQTTASGAYHVTSVKVDASKDGKDVRPPVSLLQQAVAETELARARGDQAPIEGMRCYECDPYPDPEEEDPIPAPSEATVLTGSDGTTKYVYNGSAYIAVASITSNWSLNRNYSHDTGANFDLFYIRDNIQIDLHNGATASNASIYHRLPYYSKDDIARKGPSNSSIVTVDGAWRHYPVEMPWGAYWNSSNIGDLSFTSEYQPNDTAYWNINAFSSKVTFSPGTAWVSYYTYAIIDLLHTVNVQYNGSTHSMTLNRTVTYDY
ncbi:hypothetical protein FHS18_006049 [Paenibacillus phyllosphaerae]|uniref:Uncharacterized protein n=1 Tax=Paenibacillus phyllosphaerae TaxID=274593 RepID=A0A7W5B421_9BACL|nr:hypothetical protein [Paenibacillus phyllosphaerae]MBB3113933.1 hypothetical protein [Paenibacillus phyllosphaerae]